MQGLYFLQQVVNAVQISLIYALLAVSFVLLYGIGRRINLAFGAFAMWSAYLTITLVILLMASTRWPLILVLIAALLIAILNTASLGFVVQRLVIIPLVNKPTQALVIATLGLAILLEEAMRLVNDSREKWLTPLFSDPVILVADPEFIIQVTQMQLGIFALSLILVVSLLIGMRQSRFGRFWRACADDGAMASLCGVNVTGTLAFTFVLASIYASLSGSLIALLYGSVSFTMGLMIGLKTLFVAVLGGLTSFRGAVIGAFLLGFLETFWSAYFEIAYRDVAVFLVLIGILILKPMEENTLRP